MKTNLKLAAVLFAMAIPTDSLASDKTFQISYGNMAADGSLENGAGVTSWKPAKNAKTNNDDNHKQGANRSGENDGLISQKFSQFTNPAMVLFSIVGEPNAEVRFTKNQDADRTQYAQSDTYSLGSEGDLPFEKNMAVSFIALAIDDSGSEDIGDQKYGDLYFDSKDNPSGITPSPLRHAADVQVSALRYLPDTAVTADRYYNVSSVTPVPDQVGKYSVVFENGFSEIPAIVVNYNGFDDDGKNENVRSVYVEAVNTASATIAITDENGSPVAAPFTMIAVGIPSASNDNYRLSNFDIAYGRYNKAGSSKGDMNRKFGYNTDDHARRVTFSNGKLGAATFDVSFTKRFKSTPFVIMSVEHEAQQHLRQPQTMFMTNPDLDGVRTQVVGRNKCCSSGYGNDARFSILAIYPK